MLLTTFSTPRRLIPPYPILLFSPCGICFWSFLNRKKERTNTKLIIFQKHNDAQIKTKEFLFIWFYGKIYCGFWCDELVSISSCSPSCSTEDLLLCCVSVIIVPLFLDNSLNLYEKSSLLLDAPSKGRSFSYCYYYYCNSLVASTEC